MCSAYLGDQIVASAPAFTSKSESELSALRAEAGTELLELVTAFAELEAQSADLAAQSLLEEEQHEKA